MHRFLASPLKVAVAVFIAALAFYVIAGWGIGADALDSDTLSLVLQWKLIRNGVVLDDWILSTPKFLPVVVDGTLYELGGDGAVFARSLVTSSLLVALAAAFAHLALGWQASLATAGLLLFGRTTFSSAFGGNSTILYATFLVGAAVCFLKWPSRRAMFAGLLLLFAACLTRIEGLAYLGLAGAVLFAVSWKHERRLSFLTAGATAGLILAVFAADLWVPSTLSGRLRSARSVTLELNERAKTIAQVTEGEGIYGQAVGRIEQGYIETAAYNLSRVIRPIVVLLPMALAGFILILARKPLPAFLLILLAITPLIYCAVLHFAGVALFDRFFLPTAVAIMIGAAFTIQEALKRTTALGSRRAAWVGSAAIFVVLAGLLGIGARDIYYNKKGYLLWRADSLREYKAGLAQLKDTDLRGKRLLVYGWHHGYTNLVLDVDTAKVDHLGDVVLIDPSDDRLARFDYLLYGKGDSDVDRLFQDVVCSDDHCSLETPSARFETFWVSPNGEFRFFRKTS